MNVARQEAMCGSDLLLKAEGIQKSYGGVLALHDGCIELGAGTVHALCGGNGAGKSTFLNILMGLEAPDSGRIWLSGTETRFASPASALAAGIAIITQELSPVPDMTVAENIFLGRESRRAGWFVNQTVMRRKAAELLLRHLVSRASPSPWLRSPLSPTIPSPCSMPTQQRTWKAL